MKTQTKQLIILAAVLAAALAVYGGLRLWNSGKEAADTAEDPAQDLVELGELSQLAFTAETGETLTFSKEEDTWISGEEPDLPLNQDLLEDVETAFCALAFQRELEEHDDLSGYGLDPAARTVTGTDATGTVCTILLGDEVDYDGIYYAMVEGRDVVYTVSGDLFDAINCGLMDLAEVEVLPALTEETVQSISLEAETGEVALNKLTEKKQQVQEQETGEVDENGDPVMEEVTVTVEEYSWFLADGAEIPEGNAALSDVLGELSSLRFTSVYDFRPTEEELNGYGLGQAAAILIVDCTDGTQLQLELGASDESGENLYARLDGSDLVHLLAASSVDSLLAMTAESLTAAAE